MGFAQGIVKRLLIETVDLFFKESDGLNVDKLPTEDPLILVCAPHANQFLDPIMVSKTCGRDVGFLAAAASMRRKFVGLMARLMNSIPVERPQDVAKKGAGQVTIEGTKVTGINTNFLKECEAEFTLAVGEETAAIIKVISDTELEIKGFKKPVTQPSAYKLIPKIDQAEVYESVFKVLKEGGCIGIFPEGGSHDRTDLLPLKAGFTIMALGALAKYPDLKLKIVPVGLNYFKAHAFRSLAYVDYGAPITINPELVEKYKQGGNAKRDACATLLEIVNEGIKEVTVTASDYETLQLFQMTRRLYKPHGVQLTPSEKLRINRTFSQSFEKLKDNAEVQKFKERVLEYRNRIKHLGFQDHQVKRIPDEGNHMGSLVLLLWRTLVLLFLTSLSIPGLILSLPVYVAATVIPKQKAKEAKAASKVKIAGRDVLATWKVFIALGFVPALWIFYTLCTVILVWQYGEGIDFNIRVIIPVLAFAGIPFLLYATVLFVERSRAIFLSLSPLFLACFSSKTGKKLKEERIQLQEMLLDLVEKLGPQIFENFEERRVIQKDRFPQRSGSSSDQKVENERRTSSQEGKGGDSEGAQKKEPKKEK